jgi:hypothetical protein
MATTISTREQHHGRPLFVKGSVAVVIAVLANALVVLGSGLFDIAPGVDPLTLPPVVLFSALGVAGATVVYGLTSRYAANPDRTFLRIAGAVLVLSFVPDIGLLVADPAATVPGVVLLMLMHVVVAAASVGALVYWWRD